MTASLCRHSARCSTSLPAVSKLQEPASASPVAEIILSTKDGGNLLVTKKAAKDAAEDTEPSGGHLYTDDMPAIEDLLSRYEVVTAVIHKPAPVVPIHQRPVDAKRASADAEAFSRALVLGGSPAVMLTAGVVMMVGAIAGATPVTNPYLALALILMGVTLGATSWLALREARRRGI